MPIAQPMALLDAALRGALIVLLILIAGILLRERPALPAVRVAVALLVGLVFQMIGSAPSIEAGWPRAWQAPLVGIAVGNAVLFWLFVRALFDDEFQLRPWAFAIWLAAAALGVFNCACCGGGGPWAALTVPVQRALPLVFAALAAWAALAQREVDLVERRRRLRPFIVVAGIVYSLAQMVERLSAPQGRPAEAVALLDSVVLLAIVAVVAWRMLRLGATELFPLTAVSAEAGGANPSRHAEGPASGLRGGSALTVEPAHRAQAADQADAPDPLRPPDAAEARWAAALQRLIDEEQIHRSDGLSVASLAARVGAPEYRLRQLINQRLGYRNFNAFVNAHRIADACTALADPQRREVAVLTIALDAGFQSIGPFNRAFKAATGLTPSEFRRARLLDS
jgi:AraC-like DNA-binding protein